MVDIQADAFEMDYDLLSKPSLKRLRWLFRLSLRGLFATMIVCSKLWRKTWPLYRFKQSGKRPLTVLWLFLIVPTLWDQLTKGQPAGSIADFTSFSFHAVKNFTTAEGGSATWKANPAIDDEEMYKEFQILSLHGQTKDALAKMQLGSWEYDIVTPAYKVQYDRYHGFTWSGSIGPLSKFVATS